MASATGMGLSGDFDRYLAEAFSEAVAYSVSVHSEMELVVQE